MTIFRPRIGNSTFPAPSPHAPSNLPPNRTVSTRRALRRAKFDLGVTTSRKTFTGAWFWALPGNQPATDAVVP